MEKSLFIAKNIKKKSKAFWKFVKKHKNNKQHIDTLIGKDLYNDEVFITNDSEMANLLAINFAGVFIKDNDNIDDFSELKVTIINEMAPIDLKLTDFINKIIMLNRYINQVDLICFNLEFKLNV